MFFKMMKHHLNLEKEAQLRDYDGIVGHTIITMVRYIFLALTEALQRLLVLVFDKVRSSGEFVEGVVIAMIDAIMGAAVEFIQTTRQLAKNNNVFSMR